MYWAQHGDDTYQCSPRKYKACSSVYVVNWKLSYCDFKCKVPSAVWSAPHGCAKAYIPKVPIFSLRHLLCNTWPDVFFCFCIFKLLYIWFDSVLMWISSAAIESSHHRLVLKQIRAMWLCELFLLSLWILHSSEWP